MKIKARTYVFGIVEWIRKHTPLLVIDIHKTITYTHWTYKLTCRHYMSTKNYLKCDIPVSRLLKISFDSLIENIVKGFKKTT